MASKSEEYTKQVLKVVVAQVCHMIGWNSIHQSSLEVLTDTLNCFMQELSRQTYRATELYQRTEPTLDDLSLAFNYLNINMSDIREYIEYVGPSDTVPVPKYPAALKPVLNVKLQAPPADMVVGPLEPTLTNHNDDDDDDDDEEDDKGFVPPFQYNRPICDQAVTNAAAGTTDTVGWEDGTPPIAAAASTSAAVNNGTNAEEVSGGPVGAEKPETSVKKPVAATPCNNIQPRRQLSSVQLGPNGELIINREAKAAAADLPPPPIDDVMDIPEPPMMIERVEKPATSRGAAKSHRHHDGASAPPSRPLTPVVSAAKKEKLPQEPDKGKLNIFKKISQKAPPPQTPIGQSLLIDTEAAAGSRSFAAAAPSPQMMVTPPPIQAIPTPKRERRPKKQKQRAPPPPANIVPHDLPALPMDTTLEALPPFKQEQGRYPPDRTTSYGNPPFLPPKMEFDPSNFMGSGGPVPSPFPPFVPNFSLPQGPGLIPNLAAFGQGLPGMAPNPFMSSQPLSIPRMPQFNVPAETSITPVRDELSSPFSMTAATAGPSKLDLSMKTQQQQQRRSIPVMAQCNVPPLVPPNLFLPDAIIKSEPTIVHVLDDAEEEEQKQAAAAAAKKEQKQRKKEQRRLEKMKMQSQLLGLDKRDVVLVLDDREMGQGGGNTVAGGSTSNIAGGEKQQQHQQQQSVSKMDKKLEKILRKKLMKSSKKKRGDGSGLADVTMPDGSPIDLSTLDEQQQRRMEKKLKKLLKNKKKGEEKRLGSDNDGGASSSGGGGGLGVAAGLESHSHQRADDLVTIRETPHPTIMDQMLPKLTLKLNSPKMSDHHSHHHHHHSPRDEHHQRASATGSTSSKDYRPLSIDTSLAPSPPPSKKLKDSHHSPHGMLTPGAMGMVMTGGMIGGGSGGVGGVSGGFGYSGGNSSSLDTLPEPELARISPLVTRPMKLEPLTTPTTSNTSRGRPRKHTQSQAPAPLPPIIVPAASASSHVASVAASMDDTAASAAGVAASSSSAGYGNQQVWICPACGRVDDGTPMIGCDSCDAWYHWVCVGIQVPPDASEDWFCRVCIGKRKEQQMPGADPMGFAEFKRKEKKRKKKEKKAAKGTGAGGGMIGDDLMM